MHKLTKKVRFTINPFSSKDENTSGAAKFTSTPEMGLSIFLELAVEVAGEVESSTGFVVNIIDIDKEVRQYAIPVFAEQIRENFQKGKCINLFETANLLKSAWGQLADKFGQANLSKLTLALNPFKNLAIDCEDCKMIYLSEKFEFAATHKLWNDKFSPDRNFEIFGKCANPSGHGHNYTVEVTLSIPLAESNFAMGDFGQIVEDEFTKLVDHKNLNVDVPYFTKTIPTMENIAVFAWENLKGKFGSANLYCITVWETDKTYCSYYGQENKKGI